MIFRNKSLYICTLITIVSMWLGIGEGLFWIFKIQNGESETFFKLSFTAVEHNISLPILSAIPYSAVLVTELKSGFLRISIFRTGYKMYVISKFFKLALTVILSQTLAIVLFSTVLYFVIGDFYLSISMLLSRLMLSMIYALIGSAFGVYAKDKIFAYAVPVAFSFFISIIGSRFSTEVKSFLVSNLLSGEQNLVLIVMLIITSIGYIILMLKEIHKNV